MKAKWLFIPVIALGLGACEKKSQETTAADPVPATEQPAESTPAPVADPAPAEEAPAAATTVTAAERAAKLGFVKHLPQDTEVVLAFHNGSSAAERIQSSKLWQLVQSEMGMGFGGGIEGPQEMDFDDEMEEDGFELPDAEQDEVMEDEDAPNIVIEEDSIDAGEMEITEFEEPAGPSVLFGTEFTIALGKPVGEQTANLLTLNRRMSYFQMRALAAAFASVAKSGDMSALQDAMNEQYGVELAKNLITDPDAGIALYERMKMPPLYLAFRTSEEDRESASQLLAATVENIGMFEEMVETVEVERAGATFIGYKVPGAKISETMAEEREDMDEMLGADTVDKLIAATATKDLVVVSGTLGDYSILFFGASIDDLKLTAALDESLAASDALTFSDSLLSKDLAAVIYGQKDSLRAMFDAVGGISDMTNGIRDGLAGAEGLGDTRDIEALLRLVGEREAALRTLSHTESVGKVAFFEEGLKIESFGGTDTGAVNWDSPNQLASLGDSEDVVMFANMTSNFAYDENLNSYLEALVQTAYALTMKAAEFEIEDESFVQFKEMSAMFDTKLRPELLGMWNSFNADFGGSLGSESAMVIDLKGAMPAIPGVPQKIVDEGKFPRISMVAPVTDRAKMAEFWTTMNTSATNILGTISEIIGEDVPMQKPISSEKDGFTTWFFSFPFLNDDFIPSVTVGDKWFAASTSKNQALDLLAKATKGGETSTGLHFRMNFKALQSFVTEMADVIEKNPDDVPMGAEELAMLRKVVTAMDDIDSLTIHARKEGGKLRSSIHFKTR